jgi:Fe-S-cluster containining protein
MDVPGKTSSIHDFGKNESITNMNNPSCKNCNECCTLMAPISVDEFKAICNHLNSDKVLLDAVVDKLEAYKDALFNDNLLNWVCVFSFGNKCSIYAIRPTVCREFHCNHPKQSKTIVADKYMLVDVVKAMIDSADGTCKDEYNEMINAYAHSYRVYCSNMLK